MSPPFLGPLKVMAKAQVPEMKAQRDGGSAVRVSTIQTFSFGTDMISTVRVNIHRRSYTIYFTDGQQVRT